MSSFSFHARTKDEGLNRDLEEFVEECSTPAKFDASGRHGRQEFTRLLEGRRCVDGDVLKVNIADGTSQAVEGDRLRNPLGQMDMLPDPILAAIMPPKGLIQGVQVSDAGRAIAYAVHRRTLWGGFEFERLVPAADCFLHGFFDRFDQVRGVSPISAALNSYEDTYEGIDYALAKSKVAQLFGIKFKRNSMYGLGQDNVPGSACQDGEDCEPPEYSKRVNFGGGPVGIDLEPGDDVEMLENKTPSTEFQAFMQIVISISLKSLDLPYSFFDESFTNFFGSRSALQLYLMSCDAKRRPLVRMLREWLRWRLGLAVLRGEFVLPSGMTVDDVVHDWIAAGTPWWNPKDEIAADLQSVEGNLRTREEIRKERYGDDWFEMMRRRKREDQFLTELGYDPSYSAIASIPGSPTLEKEQPVAGERPDDVPAQGAHKPGAAPAAKTPQPAAKGGGDGQR